MIALSLNETEMLAQKAAHGAGLPWGLAEDAGRAARWLAQRSTAWATTLLAMLDAPPAAAHCPFQLGSFVADSAALPFDRIFPRVAWPLWLVPALHAAATSGRRPVAAQIGTVEICCRPEDGADIVAPWPLLEALAVADVHVRAPAPAATPLPELLPAPSARPLIEPDLLARLEAYAARTYVPATEESRRKGAGAGLHDDD